MKTLVSWSSGKDSAWMLHVLKQDPSIEIGGLLTTMNEQFDRVAMHAVRQAAARGAGGRGGRAAADGAAALALHQRAVRGAHARGRRRRRSPRGSRTSRSAICFSKTCGSIARRSSPAPA